MPTAAATTIYTDQFMNGDTCVQVKRHVGDEEATAFPTMPGISLFSVLSHFPDRTPKGGGVVYRYDLARDICSTEMPWEVWSEVSRF